MKIHTIPLLALAACVLPSSALHAQEARTVRFRTLCLEQTAGVTSVHLPAAKSGADAVEVPLYTGSLSPEIVGNFTGKEAVFTGAPGADGKPAVMAKVALASSSRQFFLFLPAKSGGAKPYEVMAFDDDTDSFKPGHIRSINLAPVPVRFTIAGKASPPVPPSKQMIFPQAAKKDDYNMYPVVVDFASAGDKWFKGYSASWKASDTRREIVITLIDPKFKQPVVKCYPDLPPWLAATP
ncbi:hypothetical protein OKA04_22050 [Luteolibacter flavescens]|uniref:DUF4397 domain-containing protein n=1 Tax=Luteolibacter flavescens TaxID=1859460 RepID=A0ABT3FV22_9BACT|nr:hypothetical protein [Luteolibacter flavescens]MCW1887435.1 hypothetical protein [Luteolibacter flavescens]